MGDKTFEDSEIVKSINNVITTDENIIAMLMDLSARVKRHASRCKIAKVAGTTATSVAILGQVAGLVMAPYTGGLSLWINVAATSVLVGGTVTTVSVNIADVFKNKVYLQNLEKHLVIHDEAAEKFRKIIENIRYIVDLLKKEGVTEEDAIFLTLKHVKDGSLKIIYNITALNITAEVIKASFAAEAGLQVGAVSSQTLAQTLGIGKTAFEGIARPEFLTFANLVKDPAVVAGGTAAASASAITTSVITSAIGVAGVGLTAAITIWEVKNLVRDWKKNHPTVDIIDDIIQKLRKEKESLENLHLPKPAKTDCYRPETPLSPMDFPVNVLNYTVPL